MIPRLKILFPSFLTSILDSYTQIFFSNNRVFALILIFVSFFDIYAGLSGLIAVISSNFMAYLIGLNRVNIRAGYYGFNSLLVGLGMGIFYQPGTEFYVLLIFASLLTLFLTVMAEGVLGKYGLPFMSIPFLFGIWLITLASRQYSNLIISERSIYMVNEMYSVGGLWLVNVYNYLNDIHLHEALTIYFRSLGAILFQYHLFAGILISIGLLIYSRIGFMLSWIGFLSAYMYYNFIGADITELSYGYIGFNYILTAIAVGGFFLIPSGYSFLWVFLLTPVIAIIQTSSMAVFSLFQLSVYSLPFNMVVLLFLYMLKFRERFYHRPGLVTFQQYSPEKNLYSQLNYKDRFGNPPYLPFSLPFIGKWKITQGENGDITHKGEWKTAWDFELTDEKDKTYEKGGLIREDYYCFNKPVLAPADGIVEEVINEVEDNDVGVINITENWGNAIVIKHAELFYSQVCHLKKGSIKVAPGDHVKTGEIIALCGSSGRSPIPHLHFQLQSTPTIGSKTLDYPLGHYLNHSEKGISLRSFEKPTNAQTVSNIEKNEYLTRAFHFIPGQQIKFTVTENEVEKDVEWEVRVNFLNETYIFCKETRSSAYFRYDGNIHIFTLFYGDKKSLLYMFHLGTWKVLTGFYPGLTVSDHYPVNILGKRFLLFFQDFIAPFYRFLKVTYTIEYVTLEDHFTHANGLLRSKVEGKAAGKTVLNISFDYSISEKGIESVLITQKNKITYVRRVW